MKPGNDSAMAEKYLSPNFSSGYSRQTILKNRMKHTSRAMARQRGMTLIVGLILLAMLMIISTVGFRNTTLSEQMAGNSFDHNTSFQSAENAGIEALAAINLGSLTGAGYYTESLSKGGTSAYWTKDAGTEIDCSLTHLNSITSPPEFFSWTSCAKEVDTAYTFSTNSNDAKNKQKARYVVELLSSVTTAAVVAMPATGTTPSIPATPKNTIYTYRVTSRSTGGSGDAEVVVQSIYFRKVIAI